MASTPGPGRAGFHRAPGPGALPSVERWTAVIHPLYINRGIALSSLHTHAELSSLKRVRRWQVGL
jgi:hypothetical protein